MSAAFDITEAPERFHPRVQTDLQVRVEGERTALRVRARDLSMAGVFLAGFHRGTGDRLTLTLLLPGDVEVRTRAVVRRREAEGVAVEFDGVDWDELCALARYVHPRLE